MNVQIKEPKGLDAKLQMQPNNFLFANALTRPMRYITFML